MDIPPLLLGFLFFIEKRNQGSEQTNFRYDSPWISSIWLRITHSPGVRISLHGPQNDEKNAGKAFQLYLRSRQTDAQNTSAKISPNLPLQSFNGFEEVALGTSGSDFREWAEVHSTSDSRDSVVQDLCSSVRSGTGPFQIGDARRITAPGATFVDLHIDEEDNCSGGQQANDYDTCEDLHRSLFLVVHFNRGKIRVLAVNDEGFQLGQVARVLESPLRAHQKDKAQTKPCEEAAGVGEVVYLWHQSETEADEREEQ